MAETCGSFFPLLSTDWLDDVERSHQHHFHRCSNHPLRRVSLRSESQDLSKNNKRPEVRPNYFMSELNPQWPWYSVTMFGTGPRFLAEVKGQGINPCQSFPTRYTSPISDTKFSVGNEQ